MTDARGDFDYDWTTSANRYINATSTCECAFQAGFAGGCM
jgi:hypothetical protein